MLARRAAKTRSLTGDVLGAPHVARQESVAVRVRNERQEKRQRDDCESVLRIGYATRDIAHRRAFLVLHTPRETAGLGTSSNLLQI